MMRSISAWVATLLLASVASIAAAAPTVLTFNPTTTGATYVEGGMTITATSAEPVRTDGRWFLDCCDGGPESFDLSTGGVFDLLSINILHADGTDPIVWKGFRNGVEVASASVNFGGLFAFTGFTSLDLVTMSVAGSFTDPSFDNLTFEVASTGVPEPASLALLGFGLAAIGAARRKRTA